MNARTALAVVAIGCALCACGEDDPQHPFDGRSPFEATTAEDVFQTDPYSASGTWKVPEDIAPGRYQVLPNTDAVPTLRWVVLCRDAYCEDSISETVEYASDSGGGDYIVIPDDGSVRGLKNNGVRLSAAE